MGPLIPPWSIPLFFCSPPLILFFLLFFFFASPHSSQSVLVLWCGLVPSILRRLLVAITVTSPRRQPPVCADGWLFSTQTHMCASHAARQRMWLGVNQFVMRMEECEGSTGKGVTASSSSLSRRSGGSSSGASRQKDESWCHRRLKCGCFSHGWLHLRRLASQS